MTSRQHTAEQQQPQQQKQKQRPVRNDERNTRITYKVRLHRGTATSLVWNLLGVCSSRLPARCQICVGTRTCWGDSPGIFTMPVLTTFRRPPAHLALHAIPLASTRAVCIQVSIRPSPAHSGGPQALIPAVLQLEVSYLGGSFCGWCRGNTHSRPSVQEALAAAIAATGLCDRGEPSRTRAKRVAGRAAQRAFTLQQAAAAAAAAPETSHMETAAAAVEAADTQQEEAAAATGLLAAASGACAEPAAAGEGAAAEATGSGESATGGAGGSSLERQMPKLLSGGRTDAGVSAVGQVGIHAGSVARA